ncbi:hypothetical protein [Leifsonia sp. Leaf264]|uniref:hypothetical protein n=1 Tax=Leifsonia sp. Leaf264 TaxID=1736314 RepID=UPI0006F884D9|nr:hypothetical protein [Leifsonia sp. Leaf264]KQO98556.1 hypothetical protein ASF30_10870 [Leifsonia sp. Leaf264]
MNPTSTTPGNVLNDASYALEAWVTQEQLFVNHDVTVDTFQYLYSGFVTLGAFSLFSSASLAVTDDAQVAFTLAGSTLEAILDDVYTDGDPADLAVAAAHQFGAAVAEFITRAAAGAGDTADLQIPATSEERAVVLDEAARLVEAIVSIHAELTELSLDEMLYEYRAEAGLLA